MQIRRLRPDAEERFAVRRARPGVGGHREKWRGVRGSSCRGLVTGLSFP